jgi:hypothetical protein
MTVDQVNSLLCVARDSALTAYGDSLLEQGLTVEDPQFAAKMLAYAHELEHWRAGALSRIAATIEEVMRAPGTIH